VPYQIPQQMPYQIPQQMPYQIPQQIPYQIPQQIYQPQPTQQPLYKPDYQPIPGLPAQPRYVVPREGPVPPGVYLPPIARPEVVMTPSDQSRIVSNPPVYTEVVLESGTTRCVTYPTDSQPCGSNCQSCVGTGQTCGNGCSNFYFSVFGGYSDLRDLDGRSGNHQMSADSGGGVGVALGRRNGRNLRTEAEFTYRHNNLSEFVTSPMLASPPVSGELNAYGGMANAYWELIDVPTRYFKPYIGAGIGFVSIDAAIRNSVGRNIVPTGAENDSSFAYQWIAGVNYKAYRNTDLFAEYRFFKADTFTLDPSIDGLGDRYTFATDNVFLGLRWKF
jgi:opacity protein-like surface antigen